MRVICIKVNRTNDHGLTDVPHPELGETVTVIDNDTKYGEHFYQFKEYSDYKGMRCWYNVGCYVPVSDLDETALVTEEFEEKYCIPVNI
jgi:hypothetical protein